MADVASPATARPTILVVEDEAPLLTLLRYNLEKQGFQVEEATDGQEALLRVAEARPDLILLDWMLPAMSGIEVCRQIRRRPATRDLPIIMVTARTEDQDAVRALDLGADDYITKPFSPREVVARVRAVLRRARGRASAEGAPVIVGGLTLRPTELVMEAGGEGVRLTPVETRLLATLMSAPERSWTRAQLVARVLGDGYEGHERTIDVHVKNLRRKLDHLPASVRAPRLETTHGVGYRLSCEA